MKKMLTLTKSFSFIILISSSLYAIDVFAKSSKEVWLEFTGTNYCEKSFCAEDIPFNLLEKTLTYFKNNQQIINNVEFLAKSQKLV
jgi:hypothetical protein